MTLQNSAQVFLEMISADRAEFKGKNPSRKVEGGPWLGGLHIPSEMGPTSIGRSTSTSSEPSIARIEIMSPGSNVWENMYLYVPSRVPRQGAGGSSEKESFYQSNSPTWNIVQPKNVLDFMIFSF